MVVLPKDSNGVETAVMQYLDGNTGELSKPIARISVNSLRALSHRCGQHVSPHSHSAFARVPFFRNGDVSWSEVPLSIASSDFHEGFVAWAPMEWADLDALQLAQTSFFLQPRDGGERIELQRWGENTPLRVAYA